MKPPHGSPHIYKEGYSVTFSAGMDFIPPSGPFQPILCLLQELSSQIAPSPRAIPSDAFPIIVKMMTSQLK